MVRCTSADFIFLVNLYAHLTPNQYHLPRTRTHLFKNTRVPPARAARRGFLEFCARPCDTAQRKTRI